MKKIVLLIVLSTSLSLLHALFPNRALQIERQELTISVIEQQLRAEHEQEIDRINVRTVKLNKKHYQDGYLDGALAGVLGSFAAAVTGIILGVITSNLDFAAKRAGDNVNCTIL